MNQELTNSPIDPLEATQEISKVLTPKEQALVAKEEALKQKAIELEKIQAQARRDQYYRTEIAALSPQVAFMKLRMEFAQYTLQHYKFSIELNSLQKGFENLAPTPATTPALKDNASFDMIVTAEDLAANPDMVKAGIKVGDNITIHEKDIVKPEDMAAYEGEEND